MEKDLFDYESFDYSEMADFLFYICTLKRDISTLKAGERFSTINLNYENGTCDFYRGETIVKSLRLKLVDLPDS